MNLRSLVNKYTQVTNNNINIQWQQSNGYTTDNAGKRTPQTITLTIEAQVQTLTASSSSASELRHIDGLNINAIMRSVYLYGNAVGAVRADKIGGDILIFPEIPGTSDKNWLITQVVETWPDWCHVIVTLQDN